MLEITPGEEPPLDVHTPEITPWVDTESADRDQRGVDHAVTYIFLLLLLHTSKSLPLIRQ